MCVVSSILTVASMVSPRMDLVPWYEPVGAVADAAARPSESRA